MGEQLAADGGFAVFPLAVEHCHFERAEGSARVAVGEGGDHFEQAVGDFDGLAAVAARVLQCVLEQVFELGGGQGL